MLLQAQTGDGTVKTLRMNKSSRMLITMPPSKSQLMNGYVFELTYSVASIGALTTPDDLMTLSFTTPAATAGRGKILLSTTAAGTAGALFTIIEGKTGAGASPTGVLPIYNRNRNSSITSLITDVAGANVGNVSYDATAFTGGTTIYSEYLAGNAGPQGAGGQMVSEWILSAATLYQVSLYNNAANAGTIKLEFIETIDINVQDDTY
jgi:hypothetical protein